MKILIAVILSLVTIGIFTGCQKDKKPKCRISAFAAAANGVVQISYNSDGKISRRTNGRDTTTYSYAGNVVTLTAHTSGSFSSRYIATLNPAGLITNLREEYNATGTNWNNTVYEYNGEELSRTISSSSAASPRDTTTFLWLNHNLVSRTSGTTTATLAYYTDKPRQDGDYLWLVNLTYGGDIYRSKNLLKSDDTISFTYEFDADGKISSMTFTIAGNSTTVSYEYECN